MNSKQLKILALVTMFYDHITRVIDIENIFYMAGDWLAAQGMEAFGMWVIDEIPYIFNYIGRLAAPIFMFCIVEGFLHTHDIKKYILRIFATAIISQPPYILFNLAESRKYGIQGNWQDVSFNILFTLGLGLLTLVIFTKCRENGKLYLGILAVILAGTLARLCHFEGNEGYILIIFMFYLLRNTAPWKKALIFIPVMILSRIRLISILEEAGIRFMSNYLLNVFGPYLGVLVTCLYNHEKGNIKKGFQRFAYVFYPLHLLILGIIGFFRPLQ